MGRFYDSVVVERMRSRILVLLCYCTYNQHTPCINPAAQNLCRLLPTRNSITTSNRRKPLRLSASIKSKVLSRAYRAISDVSVSTAHTLPGFTMHAAFDLPVRLLCHWPAEGCPCWDRAAAGLFLQANGTTAAHVQPRSTPGRIG
jgi:hypothetical protein